MQHSTVHLVRRAFRPLLAVLLIGGLAACGDSPSSPKPVGEKPTHGSGATAAPARTVAPLPTATDAPFSFGWFTQQQLAGDWLIQVSNPQIVSVDCAAQQGEDAQDPAELAQIAQYVSLLSVYSSVGGSFESSGRGQYRFVIDPDGEFAGQLAASEMPTQFAADIGYDGSTIIATQSLQIPRSGGPTGSAALLLATAVPLGLAVWAVRRRRAIALPLLAVLLLTQLSGCVGLYGGISSQTRFARIAEGQARGGFTPLLELQQGRGTIVFDLTLVTEEQEAGAAADAPTRTVEDSCRIEADYEATAALFRDGVVTQDNLPQLVEAGYLPAGITEMLDSGSDE